MSRVYFFGCAAAPNDPGAGHFLYTPGRSWAGVRSIPRDESKETPWPLAELDGTLLEARNIDYRDREEQVQGRAKLHHKNGWTALSLWDRTGDHRGASNSALVAEGEFSFEEMTALFASTFPVLWARITAAGTVTSHPSNPRPAPAQLRIAPPAVRISSTAISSPRTQVELLQIGEALDDERDETATTPARHVAKS